MEQITNKEFEGIVLNGLASDIFIAERSYAMFKTIGDEFEKIKQTRRYAELFKVTQTACKDQFLLATARLFDTPSDRNRTRCVHGLLKFMSSNLARLPNIVERPNLVAAMRFAGFDNESLKLAYDGGNDKELATRMILYYENLLQNDRNQPLLTQLKVLRDKRLAHNDLIQNPNADLVETIDVITFKDLFGLVDIAKKFVGVIGWAYMNMVFVHDGNYHLTADAIRPVHSLKHLIDNLNSHDERDN